MTYLREYKYHILLLLALTALYFFTRIYNILGLPIFTDEAIYLRWAQIAKGDAGWRFISLTDGKQPSFVWAAMTAMYVIKDPLLAGRLVSVAAGFASIIGLFFVGRELFKNWWIGFLSAFLYVLYPFALVLDRMALYDTLVGTFVIWSFYIAILLAKKVHSSLAFVLALVLGAGALTKTSAFFASALLPTTLLLFDWKPKERMNRLIKWCGLAAIAVVLSYMYYSVLRLSPFFYIIATKNTEFVYPMREWLQHPFTYFIGNGTGIWTALVGYIGIPMMILIVLSFSLDKSLFKEKALLFLWFIAPLLYLAFFGKLIYPRHYFFATVFLLPLISFALYTLYQRTKRGWVIGLLIFVLLSRWMYNDFFILTNFSQADIPNADKSQYSTGWPAGGGVKEALAYFEKEAKDKKITIITQGTFGLMPYALQLYLQNNQNVKADGLWPTNDMIPEDILANAAKMPTYVLFYQPCPNCGGIGNAPPLWPLKEVLRVKKSENVYLTVYQVVPK